MADAAAPNAPPLPSPTPTSAPFWSAAAHDQLAIQRCDGCGTWIYYPRSHCPTCLRPEPAWHTVSGAGTIYAFTVARQPTSTLFDDAAPPVIAIVELDEGPRLTTTVVGSGPEDVTVGARVMPVFEHVDDDHTLVRFRLA